VSYSRRPGLVKEHKAGRGLISKDEWNRIKDLPPARGSGAGIEMPRPTTKAGPHSSGDPSDPLYQEEYEAHERYVSARDQLRASLERGDFEAAALDPFSGTYIRCPHHYGAGTVPIG